jgi:hypothetical protein
MAGRYGTASAAWRPTAGRWSAGGCRRRSCRHRTRPARGGTAPPSQGRGSHRRGSPAGGVRAFSATDGVLTPLGVRDSRFGPPGPPREPQRGQAAKCRVFAVPSLEHWLELWQEPSVGLEPTTPSLPSRLFPLFAGSGRCVVVPFCRTFRTRRTCGSELCGPKAAHERGVSTGEWMADSALDSAQIRYSRSTCPSGHASVYSYWARDRRPLRARSGHSMGAPRRSVTHRVDAPTPPRPGDAR